MSSAIKWPPAFVGWLRSRLPMRELAMVTLLVCMFSQGWGGALTAAATVALAAATLIVVGGTVALGVRNGRKYREYGWSMLSMGTYGEEKTQIFRTFRGGFTVDAMILRWVYVVVAGLTSLGINIGIAEADGSIGTGPRMTIMALGPLMAGFTLFVIARQWNQLILRGLILGGIVFAVALFSSDGSLELSGLFWAAVVALHMFVVQKALTAFGTEAFDSETNKALSQRYRDIGMTLANVVCLVLIVPLALLRDSFPTPDKFAGASLPVLALYILIPMGVMVIPVLGMNWTRNYLSEEDQAMWTSTAPVWGAFAALSLAFIGWVTTPALDVNQWVGIVIVVLAALAAGIDVAVRKAWADRLALKDAENAELKRRLAEAEAKVEQANEAAAKPEQADAGHEAAQSEFDGTTEGSIWETRGSEPLTGSVGSPAELGTPVPGAFGLAPEERYVEAEPSASLGGGSFDWDTGEAVLMRDGSVIFNGVTGLVVQLDDEYTIEAKGLSGGSLMEGLFTGTEVIDGTVSNGVRTVKVPRGAVTANPHTGTISIKKKSQGESSLGAASVE